MERIRFDECDTIMVSAAMSVSGYPKAVAAWLRLLNDILEYRNAMKADKAGKGGVGWKPNA